MDEDRSVYADEVTCPYCGYEYNDSWEFPDDGEEECPECGKKFNYTRNVSVSYECYKDCIMNGEQHDFEWRDTNSESGGAYFCKKCPEIKLKEKEAENVRQSDEVDKKIKEKC